MPTFLFNNSNLTDLIITSDTDKYRVSTDIMSGISVVRNHKTLNYFMDASVGKHFSYGNNQFIEDYFWSELL